MVSIQSGFTLYLFVIPHGIPFHGGAVDLQWDNLVQRIKDELVYFGYIPHFKKSYI